MLTSSITSSALESLTNTNKTSSVDSIISGVGESFADVLQSLSESEQETDSLISQFAAGEDVDIHTLTMAMEENDINFKVTMAIRNKLVDAYHEIARMSI